MVTALGACNRAAYNKAEVARMVSATVSPTPIYTRAPWQPPTYLALDYGEPGEPKLTASETGLVRKTLAIVKPCQRQLLQYAFPWNAPPKKRMVLFFSSWNVPVIQDAHVLYNTNLYYTEGRLGAGPDPVPSDIRNDIRLMPCAN